MAPALGARPGVITLPTFMPMWDGPPATASERNSFEQKVLARLDQMQEAHAADMAALRQQLDEIRGAQRVDDRLSSGSTPGGTPQGERAGSRAAKSSEGAPRGGPGAAAQRPVSASQSQLGSSQECFLRKNQSDVLYGEKNEKEQLDEASLSMLAMTQRAAIRRAQQKRHALRRRHFVIMPDSFFRSVWDVIAVLIIFFVAIVLPYRIAFEAPATANLNATHANSNAASSSVDPWLVSRALAESA